jgi:hypothetical protein
MASLRRFGRGTTASVMAAGAGQDVALHGANLPRGRPAFLPDPASRAGSRCERRMPKEPGRLARTAAVGPTQSYGRGATDHESSHSRVPAGYRTALGTKRHLVTDCLGIPSWKRCQCHQRRHGPRKTCPRRPYRLLCSAERLRIRLHVFWWTQWAGMFWP